MSKIISSAMAVVINGSLKFCEIIVPEKILPYDQLEYIQSTGTQYIDTLQNPLQKMRYVMDFAKTNTNTCSLLGSRSPNSGTVYGSNNNFNVFMSVGSVLPFSITSNERYTLDLTVDSENEVTRIIGDYNDTVETTSVSISNYSVPIFCEKDQNKAQGFTSLKMYGFQIYVNDVLVMDLIPCRVKATSEVGMWDLVTDTFFGNSGTDYFVAGDDISAQSLNTLGITSAETIEENTKMLNSMGVE